MSINLDAIIVVDSCQTNRLKYKCLRYNYLLFEREGANKNTSIIEMNKMCVYLEKNRIPLILLLEPVCSLVLTHLRV